MIQSYGVFYFKIQSKRKREIFQWNKKIYLIYWDGDRCGAGAGAWALKQILILYFGDQLFKVTQRMLTIKELEALIELLNKKEETLERVEEIFLSKFKDSEGVFRASYALANLLNLNLLTSLQRIPAIFLLIQNYKTEGISHHPFGATIFEILQNTPEPFERKMISDIIIDSNREEYSRVQLEVLLQQQQTMINPVEERSELKHIKEQFLSNLPNISQQSQSEVKNVIRDFMEKDKNIEIPDYHVNLSTIKEAEIDEQSFNVGFMRPIPKFIDVDASEFHWLSPSVYSEVMWDSTLETTKKLAKGKALFKKALDQHLTKDQCTEVEKALDSEPASCLSMEVTPEMMNSLIKQNPFLAATYLVKLSNYPIIQTYLKSLLECEVSVNSIDVVSKLSKSIKIPSQFLIRYTNTIITKVLQMPQANKDRQKLARIVINFIKLKKTKLGNFEEIQQNLDKFLEQFIAVEEVQQFRKLLSKE